MSEFNDSKIISNKQLLRVKIFFPYLSGDNYFNLILSQAKKKIARIVFSRTRKTHRENKLIFSQALRDSIFDIWTLIKIYEKRKWQQPDYVRISHNWTIKGIQGAKAEIYIRIKSFKDFDGVKDLKFSLTPEGVNVLNPAYEAEIYDIVTDDIQSPLTKDIDPRYRSYSSMYKEGKNLANEKSLRFVLKRYKSLLDMMIKEVRSRYVTISTNKNYYYLLHLRLMFRALLKVQVAPDFYYLSYHKLLQGNLGLNEKISPAFQQEYQKYKANQPFNYDLFLENYGVFLEDGYDTLHQYFLIFNALYSNKEFLIRLQPKNKVETQYYRSQQKYRIYKSDIKYLTYVNLLNVLFSKYFELVVAVCYGINAIDFNSRGMGDNWVIWQPVIDYFNMKEKSQDGKWNCYRYLWDNRHIAHYENLHNRINGVGPRRLPNPDYSNEFPNN